MANRLFRSRKSGRICAALLLALHPPAEADPVSPQKFRITSELTAQDLRRINMLIAEKQFDRAMKEVEAFEKGQPRDVNVFIAKGTIYLARHELPAARKSFEHALELKPDSVPVKLDLAEIDLLEKKPAAAQARYQSILASDPGNAQAMTGMARIAADAGNEGDYVTWLQRAISAGQALQPRLMLGGYYLSKGDIPKAASLAAQAQTIEPKNPQVLDFLGSTQLAAKDARSAVATYTTLAAIAPTAPQVHYKLAVAQAAMNDPAAAKKSLTRALELNPAFLQASVLLASVELSAGRSTEALQIAKQVQKQYPKSSVGLTIEGDVLMNEKQYARAEKTYEQAFRLNASGVAITKLHKALVAQGKDAQAQQRLTGWLKDHPADAATRAYLASYYASAGRNSDAVAQYETIVQTQPNNAIVLNELAWLYFKAGNARALPTAEKAYDLMPSNAAIADTLGWILTSKGETGRGLQVLRKAAELDPAAPLIRYHLAVALAKIGENKQARSELERVLDNNIAFDDRPNAERLLRQLKE